MQKFNSFMLLIATIIVLPSAALAGPGRTGAQILNLGGGTRAAALGDAFSATTGDVTTALWNPSGLAIMRDKGNGQREKQAAISFVDFGQQLFGEAGEGLYYAFFAGALPLQAGGTLGTTLQIEGQGTISVTTDSPEPIREENLGTNWAWTMAYADRLSERLSAGIAGKIIQMRLAQESGRAFAVDLGIQYDLPVPIPVKIGAAVQHWGTRIKFKDENQSDPLPRMLRLGTAATLYEDMHHRLRLVADVTAFIDKLKEDDEEGVVAYLKEHPDVTRSQLLADRGVGIHALQWRHLKKGAGIEYWLGNILALRAGYKSEPGINLPQFTDHFAYGLGVRLLNYQFDYALIPGGGPENKRLHVFALILKF